MLQAIAARVKIKTTKEVEYFIYNVNELRSLIGEASKSSPEEIYFNVGSYIHFNGQEYKIVDVRSKLFPETYSSLDNTGINLSGEGQSSYNFQITLIVEEQFPLKE